MVATNTPQAAATTRSRRRSWPVWLEFRALIASGSRSVSSSVAVSIRGRSSWLIQHARSLHQRDDIEQDDQRAERERDGDRARAPLALLLLGEDDPFRLVVHVASSITAHPHTVAWPRRPPTTPSTRRTAKRTKR